MDSKASEELMTRFVALSMDMEEEESGLLGEVRV